ncbi:MAG: signal recognition particle-docking protein FtsY [Acidimicrobiales bacterium]|nr:signal recognition particle-docking protein FtsY [Acidimicrobiales bacterium]
MIVASAAVSASSDVLVGLAIAIPVLIVGVGAAVGLRLRGRGIKGPVPPGEVVSDAPTDVELERSAEATRTATPDAEATATPTPSSVGPASVEEAERAEPVEEAETLEPATYRGRLGKARGLLAGYLGSVRSKGKIDSTTWDDLEEALIRADVGVGATEALLNDLRGRVKSNEIVGPEALVDALKSDLVSMLSTADGALAMPGSPAPAGAADLDADDGRNLADDERPVAVWLFVGVNGVGKTTTVGKVASRMSAAGTKVLLAAGDTFRAAAGEQLSLWASRADADIVRGSEGGDPSSVVFDAVQRAATKGHAVVLADTAGRLHNKINLIEELKKIRRVADRPPGRVVEVLLVLDATTGQNGLAQAKVFLDAVDVSGVVLTKLDGTAKGGIVVAIQRELGLPVKLVGLGEGVEDLVDFDPEAFVDALF